MAEDLGFGGSAEFLRCAACRGVLVVQRDRRWRVDPEAPAAEDLNCG